MLWQPLASEKLLAELAAELSAARARPFAHSATVGLGSLGSLRSPLRRRPPHRSLSTGRADLP
eukprot:7102740-Prymnesium_polylepis.1